MRHAMLHKILSGLTSLSLLVSAIPAPLQAAPRSFEAPARLQSEVPLATPTPVSLPQAYPPPEPVPEPSPTPLPTPLPEAFPTTPAPADELLGLELSAPASTLLPGESTLLAWRIPGWQPDLRLSLEINLPDGFTPLEAPNQRYDPAQHSLWLEALAAQGQLALAVREDLPGPYPLSVRLWQAGQPLAQASYTYQEEGLSQVGREGGLASGLAGLVQVSIPGAALDEALEVRIRRPSPGRQPPYSLSGSPFEILARGQTSRQEKQVFATPLHLEVRYDPARLAAPESLLRLYTFNPQTQTWEMVPSRVEAENDRLVAELSHLSLYDIHAEGWEAARLPSLQGYQTELFSGAASYSLPLWTPPGPGGLQPALELSYNSQVVDNARAGFTQASWVGMGWSLETGSIERDQHGTENTADDSFTLQAGGISSRLLLGSDGYYHTSEESFWRIQYDSQADRWTAQDGRGNSYIFGETSNARASYPSGMADCALPESEITWRWSLSRQTNAYGKALLYTYTKDSQLKTDPCDPDRQYWTDTASYLERIEYPDSPYQVHFTLEDRSDYREGWADPESLTFYQSQRLDQIEILDGTSTLRTYDFSYAANPQIFPNLTWEAGGPTLALTGVQELGPTSTLLPPTSFSYSTDGLHLDSVTNGYGGTLELNYANQPWNDLALQAEKGYSDKNGCEYRNGEWRPSYIFGYNGGQSWCETNAQGGNPQLYLNGAAVLDLPVELLQPGAAYSTRLAVNNQDLWDQPISVQVGLLSNLGVIAGQTIGNLADHASAGLQAEVVLPAGANSVRQYLYCSGKCLVQSQGLNLLATRYRVAAEEVWDGLQATPQVTSYRYDEPAMNDAAHSSVVQAGGELYDPASSQFRGHALTQATGPDGRVSTTFFHQDDSRKGRPSLSLVSSAEFQTDYESATLNGQEWSLVNNPATSVERLLGDLALKLNGDASWRGLTRSGWSLGQGEMVLVQFRAGAAAQAVLALETGVSGNPTYRRWGVYLTGDGLLYAQVHDGSGFSNRQVLFDNTPEPAPAMFQRDAWYCLLLVVDSDGFLTRAWQRDEPAVFSQYRAALNGGPAWQFVFYGKGGPTWLDTYQEGRLFSLSQSSYSPAAASASQPGGYSDLKIQTVQVSSQERLTFEGDGDWVGQRADYRYDSYGNQIQAVESEWLPGGMGWRARRLTVSGYYPNSGSGYIVGLPGYRNLYRCAETDSPATCLDTPPPNERRADSTWFLYDEHALYSDPPSYGRPSGSRRLLREDGGTAYYQDERWTADAWGNQLSRTVYVDEGTWGTPAWQKPQTSHATYDSTYHAYRLVEENELEQQTTWTYNTACGLAESETGPNGVATTILAGYDEACRLVMLVRPGDSLESPTLQISYFDSQQPFRIDLQQRVTAGQVSLQRRYVAGLGRMAQQVMVGAALADNACSTDADTLDDSCDVRVDYRYDGNGQLIQQTVPYAAPTNSSGAWAGQQLGQPSVHTGYDLLGRVSLVTAPDGTQTASSYSDGGESLEQGAPYTQRCVSNANAQTTCTLTDLLGRVRRVSPPLGPQVAYSYDVEDQLVGATYGGASTLLSYDLGGRKVGMDDPDLGSWSYAYDALGNLTRQADARGQRVCLYYDALNRLRGKHYRLDDACPTSAPGSLDVAYAYDDESSQYGIGYRTGMADDSGSTSWEYDVRGRVSQEIKEITGSGSFTTQWSYNSADLVASMTYPGGSNNQAGEMLTYAYHPQMALKSVYSSSGYYYVPSISYDAAGRVDVRKLGAVSLGALPTLQVDYDYFDWGLVNGQGRLKRIQAGLPANPASLLDLRYFSGTNTPAYDAVGNLLNIYDFKTGNPQTQSFEYDGLDRLTSAAASGGTQGLYSEDYTYATATGNLASKGGITYTYDTEYPHAVASTSNGNSYDYDDNGNQTERSIGGVTTTLEYDEENRLKAVKQGTTTLAAFVYDGDGVRVQGTVGGVTTTYVGNYVEWTGSTSTMKRYYYAGGIRVAMRVGSTLYYLLGDHLGSTSVAATSSGGLQSKVLYKAWGEDRYTSGTLPTGHRYTGQYSYMAEIGLYYYGARWYDPNLMQFNQPDTLVPDPYQPLDWNRYSYARYNPLRYTDPTGHMVSSGCESEGCDLENHWQSAYVLEKILAGKQKPWEQLTVAYRNTLEKSGWTTKSYNSEFITGNTTDINGTFQDPAAYVAIGGGVTGRYVINAGIKAASLAVTASAKAAAKWAIEKCFVNPACLGYLARFYPLGDHPRIARQTDPFHNFPRLLDPLIVKYGDVVIKSETYAQFNAEGSIGDFTGVYELGIQLIDLTLQITHHFFRPQ